MTRDDLDLSLVTVKQIEKDTGIRMVLVDTTEQETMPSIMDIFGFAEKLPAIFRFAAVVSEKQPTKNNHNFLETVAVTRRINMKVFSARKEAIDWLKGL